VKSMSRPDRYNSSQAEHARAAAIDRAAADWVARRGRGLTPPEQAEFSRWFVTDRAHAAAFAELERTWRALDGLKEVRLADGRRLDDDLPPVGGYRRRKLAFFYVALAAAAGIAMMFLVRSPTVSPVVIAQSATTEVGGFKIMSLPDGSVVQLNTDSAVEIRYTGNERRAYLLNGEASFDVAKDATRPFIVRARSVEVRAVGTAFNVRLRAEACEVLVTEGKVRVDSSASRESLLPGTTSRAEPAMLVAGERVVVDLASLTGVSPGTISAMTASHVAVLSSEDIRRELAWQDRRLEFESTPFTEVVAEFNRHNHHKLIIADPRLAERCFGGSFSAGNAEAFVRLLEIRFGVKAERRENETLLRLVDLDPR
jgi:transmembrane sensor